jgi:GABA(A) receptor-associated protein
MGYKEEVSFDDRSKESTTMLQRFPDRIPIIVERRCEQVPRIDKRKYMAPSSLTMGQFAYVIRKRLKLKSSDAIFLFLNKKLMTQASSLESVYAREKDEDGFLYVIYDFENSFG